MRDKSVSIEPSNAGKDESHETKTEVELVAK